MSIILNNIQRFSLHDGPGIRTVIFLKGCSLHCPWCANPETIHMDPEGWYDQEECKRQACFCTQRGHCNQSFINDGASNCFFSAKGIYGHTVEEQMILNEILKDEKYYRGGGGVTFSGGEPLLQIEKYRKLIAELRDKKISCCVETAGFVHERLWREAVENINIFIVDIKILNEIRCKEVLGGELDVFLKNIDFLFQKKKKVWFRIPVISSYTDDTENMEHIIRLVRKYVPERIEIFKYHDLGVGKYLKLGRKAPKVNDISYEFLKKYKELLLPYLENVFINEI